MFTYSLCNISQTGTRPSLRSKGLNTLAQTGNLLGGIYLMRTYRKLLLKFFDPTTAQNKRINL